MTSTELRKLAQAAVALADAHETVGDLLGAENARTQAHMAREEARTRETASPKPDRPAKAGKPDRSPKAGKRGSRKLAYARDQRARWVREVRERTQAGESDARIANARKQLAWWDNRIASLGGGLPHEHADTPTQARKRARTRKTAPKSEPTEAAQARAEYARACKDAREAGQPKPVRPENWTFVDVRAAVQAGKPAGARTRKTSRKASRSQASKAAHPRVQQVPAQTPAPDPQALGDVAAAVYELDERVTANETKLESLEGLLRQMLDTIAQ